jgi:3-mercaptopyruvate sulfurtransferase SseA
MPRHSYIMLQWLVGLLALVACQAKVPAAGKEVPRLTVEEVKALQDAGEKVVIVDTRAPRSYRIRHIPGAVSIPVQEMEERYLELPRDATIAFY